LQVLKLAEKAGLAKLGHVALDGTKIKMCASGTPGGSRPLPGGAEVIRTDGHRRRWEISGHSSLRHSRGKASSRLYLFDRD
jgi:hypothetical protein